MTSTELALPDEIVNPLTGELVATADTGAVAHVISDLREHKRRVDEAIAAFSEIVLAESRRLGTKTLNVGGITAKVSADHAVVWDVTELVKLLDAGLPPERYADLVTEIVTYKVDGSVARQVAGGNPEYAAIIERAKGSQPKRAYVSISK